MELNWKKRTNVTRQELAGNAYRIRTVQERNREPDWDGIFAKVMEEVKKEEEKKL